MTALQTYAARPRCSDGTTHVQPRQGHRRIPAPLTHAEWLICVEHALREANIQLAVPHLQTVTVTALRDRIDALLEIVPRAVPVNQRDED